MKLKWDYLTVGEILSVDAETFDLLYDKIFFDFKVGDKFFFKDGSGEVYTILDDRDSDAFVYEDGQAKYEDIYPIFTTGMLIELLTEMHSFSLNSFGHGWMLLWNGELAIQSEEDELFVLFLWRALIEIVKSGKYVW